MEPDGGLAEGGLATAGLPDQRDDVVLGDLEVHAVDRADQFAPAQAEQPLVAEVDAHIVHREEGFVAAHVRSSSSRLGPMFSGMASADCSQ